MTREFFEVCGFSLNWSKKNWKILDQSNLIKFKQFNFILFFQIQSNSAFKYPYQYLYNSTSQLPIGLLWY